VPRRELGIAEVLAIRLEDVAYQLTQLRVGEVRQLA
jgi:hypothetical protein